MVLVWFAIVPRLTLYSGLDDLSCEHFHLVRGERRGVEIAHGLLRRDEPELDSSVELVPHDLDVPLIVRVVAVEPVDLALRASLVQRFMSVMPRVPSGERRAT